MKKWRSVVLGNWVFWGIILAGVLISFSGFKVAKELENQALRSEQNRLTDLITDALKQELEINRSVLSSIGGLYLASSFVSRDEFALFTKFPLLQHSSIQALEWIPHVIDSERKSYRKLAIEDGLSDFDITERNPQGEMVSAPPRTEYFPVYYVEPMQRNKSALGFDLASNAKRLASLQLAKQTRQPQVTASITLVQEKAQQKGFLIFHPIFKPSEDESGQQPEIFQGFALGVFRIGELFETAINSIGTHLNPLQLELADITDPQRPKPLYDRAAVKATAALSEPIWRVNRDIKIANRRWQLSSIATTEFIAQHQDRTHWLVLAIGLILTTLIAAYQRTLTRRASLISRVVAQRTQALQASEDINNTILDNAADAVITIDGKGCINLFNPAAERLFGHSPDEVVGHNVNMLMPEPYRAEHDGYLQHYEQTGEKRIIGIGREVTGQRKDGSTFQLHLSVGKGMVDGEPLYVGTISDLTEIRKNQQLLQDYRDRLDLATSSGGIGVWEYDVSSGELIWDERMFALYGVKRAQFPGAYEVWQQALHPDDIEQAEAELAEAIKGGAPFDTEFRIRLPDGQQRYLHATAVVLFDDKGQSLRMIGTNMDITEHKQSEMAQREAKEAAEKANQQKSAFLNVMSHELRTPLTVILGYLPILQNRQQPSPPELVAQIADDMNISGQHLLEMINDLLDISKIEAGQLELRLEEINSQSLIEEMLHRFEHPAQQKGLQLRSDIEAFNFQADELRLRQILINLIGNALKFTHEGSITVSVKQNDGVTTFRVTDTGIGIPEAELPFIFKPFRQVDNSSTRKTGGSGLGLAITKQLVELHSGIIRVTSKPDKGTTFTFTIS